MDKRDQILAKLALALQLVDNAGFQRALQLVPRLPGRTFDRVLLEAGLIDASGHKRLIQAYQARVRQARDFLDGSGVEPVRRVDRAMQDAAGRLDFEYAAILRDRGDRLRRFQEELQELRVPENCRTIQLRFTLASTLQG